MREGMRWQSEHGDSLRWSEMSTTNRDRHGVQLGLILSPDQ